jgi:hypothetical protein
MIYSEVEGQVIEILKAYGKLTDSSDEYKVIFQKSKVLISDGEVLENIKKRMDMGLITRVEALQIIDPNLTDDDASKKLEKINEERQNNINTFMGETTEVDTEENNGEESN